MFRHETVVSQLYKPVGAPRLDLGLFFSTMHGCRTREQLKQRRLRTNVNRTWCMKSTAYGG